MNSKTADNDKSTFIVNYEISAKIEKKRQMVKSAHNILNSLPTTDSRKEHLSICNNKHRQLHTYCPLRKCQSCRCIYLFEVHLANLAIFNMLFN